MNLSSSQGFRGGNEDVQVTRDYRGSLMRMRVTSDLMKYPIKLDLYIRYLVVREWCHSRMSSITYLSDDGCIERCVTTQVHEVWVDSDSYLVNTEYEISGHTCGHFEKWDPYLCATGHGWERSTTVKQWVQEESSSRDVSAPLLLLAVSESDWFVSSIQQPGIKP